MFGQISDSKNEQLTSADFIGFDLEDLEESKRVKEKVAANIEGCVLGESHQISCHR